MFREERGEIYKLFRLEVFKNGVNIKNYIEY